jgi:predicted RNA-binding protein with PIN domain
MAVLVVDAYNVIHDWWSPTDGLELGMCRDRLLGDLASYAAMQQVRTIVVFDAHQVPTKAVQETLNGLEVHYSAADETADTLIERLCFTLRDAGESVTVATSDRVQAQVVFGKGVYRLSARSLRQEVDRSAKEAKQLAKAKKRQEKAVRLEHTLDAETRAKLEKLWRQGR